MHGFLISEEQKLTRINSHNIRWGIWRRSLMYLLLSQTKRWHTITCSKLKIKHPDDVIHLVLLPIMPFCLTLWAPTQQNGQTHSNNSPATTDELPECVQPFRRVGASGVNFEYVLATKQYLQKLWLKPLIIPDVLTPSPPSLRVFDFFENETADDKRKNWENIT